MKSLDKKSTRNKTTNKRTDKKRGIWIMKCPYVNMSYAYIFPFKMANQPISLLFKVCINKNNRFEVVYP